MTLRVDLGVALAGCLAATLASAHHSYAAFDGAQTRILQGTISSVDWSNPHIAFKMLVAVVAGAPPEQWRIESSSPSILARYGWSPSTLTPGEQVSVVCNPMSDGTHAGRLHTLLLVKTGRTLETKLSTSLKSPQF